MHAHILIATVLAAIAAPVAAEQPTTSLPAVTAEAVLYVADCQDRALPTQRQVGEWTGQHNFSQVYATRQRLMAEIGRACQRAGAEQVHVVMQTRAAVMEQLAVVRRGK
jgi:hypothetical protein